MRIELPDCIATALQQSHAATQGMSLEAWFEKLAALRSAKPRYTLGELMQQCDPQAPSSDEDRAWLEALPVGREPYGAMIKIATHEMSQSDLTDYYRACLVEPNRQPCSTISPQNECPITAERTLFSGRYF